MFSFFKNSGSDKNLDLSYQQYAKEYGFQSVEPKKDESKTPKSPLFESSKNEHFNKSTEQVTNNRLVELMTLGIPDIVIEMGDAAIEKYAKENGINLPPKKRMNILI